MLQAFLILAVGTLTGAEPAHEAPPVPAPPPTAAALVAAGWTPLTVPAAPVPPCAVELPDLLRAQALPLLGRPAAFPRPALNCKEQRAQLPLALVPQSLQWDRDKTDPAAHVQWKVRIRSLNLGQGVLAASVDVPPLLTTPEPSTRSLDADQGVLFPAPEDLAAATVLAPVAPTVIRDPGRLGGPTKLYDPPPLTPPLVALPAAELAHDALIATLDDGKTWVELDLQPPAGQSIAHRLLPENIFAVRSQDGSRSLLVAPHPLRPRAEFDALLVRQGPDGPRVDNLGPVKPVGAPWSCEATAARQTEDGVLEIIVLVRTTPPRSWPREDVEGRLGCWGAVMRRSADGTWAERRRFALPDRLRTPVVRFHAPNAAQIDLEASGLVVATQVLPW